MDKFVEELDRMRREWARLHGGSMIRWSAVWRERIVAWVRGQQALGRVVPELSEELAIPVTQLRSWMYTRRRWRAPYEEPDVALLRPVQIETEMVHMPDGAPERRYTVRLRTGVRVNQLTLAEVTEVLRSLI